MQTQIRTATKEDLPIIQAIARNTIDKCYRPFLGDEGVDWFINSGESDKELESNIANCDIMLKGNVIVAFTIYFDELIHLMMVDVNQHRKGLGAELLVHTEKMLFERGCQKIRLETFEGNIQAINFYNKNSWSITKKETGEEFGFTRIFFEKSG